MTTCVVTGGAGFIGCALSASLADRFDQVVAIDNLHPQVHSDRSRPEGLDPRVELVVGDVTEAADWEGLLDRFVPDVIVHLAAETGTAQSLSEASRHGMVNVVGTTRMLDALARRGIRPRSIVLTSSRAVYGEGAWRDSVTGEVTFPGQRSSEMLTAHQWVFPGLEPLPHRSHDVHATPSSVYGATKLCQENLVSAWCRSMGVAAVLFRLQNVYGPGQSLTNPYTGIVPLFARTAKAGQSIPVYEDGEIVRDFVYIDDVASAIVAGTDLVAPTTDPIDIGSGQGTTIMELATMVAKRYGAPAPHVTGQFREGDVRSGVADIEAAKAVLAWRPAMSVERGIGRLCDWIDGSEQH
ncbi:NAD-dependent epimerase/dehydratase family protein [Oerskovia enterophila]|uniref:dTDP-L-rhamnose 4-epimerase n=1 Tax=Oerskovia enterophila TaxID=43678 RepID=A0A163Q8I7_9CELL|nr:NAD-dependent epimerase/dehydratase family protein [Oerskovia enterophila]KZM33899.1 dTDP-L-rhamnose 4-epimerase [Oerskovia enterophila]OCI32561.1 dTDP-L-rhamnose 4-epimerase [Oerskovia enterophila]